MCGWTFLTNDFLPEEDTSDLIKHVIYLAHFLQELKQLLEVQPCEPGPVIFNPEDLVLVQALPSFSLSLRPDWEAPYTLLLSTPSAMKVTRIDSWIHYTQVKARKTDGITSVDLENHMKH